MKLGKLPQSRLLVVAVPAHNEASCIADCLAALALQRDEAGAPITRGSLEILVFANSCSDETVSLARTASQSSPHPVTVIEEEMPPGQLNAGWARKRAMDLAAIRLAEAAPIHGIILTTDADSRVAPTWLAATMREFENGADCVAGYIDAIPAEYVTLGGDFLARSTLGAIRGHTTPGRIIAYLPEQASPLRSLPMRRSAVCRHALSAKIRR
jgi:glycosyltransferase involved in cell wall biosynthesis